MIYFTMIPDFEGNPHAAFFEDDLRARDTIPTDAVAITAKRHADLLAAQADGAVIEPCPKTGKPLVKRPHHDPASLRAGLIAAVKTEARNRILAIAPMWRQMNDAMAVALGEVDDQVMGRIARVAAIRAASGRIEEQIESAASAALKQFPVASHPYWPETD